MQEYNRQNRKEVIAPRWLTFKTATTYAGVCEVTLRNWAKAGHLTLHNVTPMGSRGRVLIDRLELDSFIEQFAGAPASAIAMNSIKEGARA